MNTKLKCLLLDDELPGLTYLKMLCEQISGIEVVKAFNSPLAFLHERTSLDFDFCIIDIEMPEMSGLQVANLLTDKPVIFATAYRDFAADAYDLNAVDYIRKPIKLERLKQAVDKVRKQIIAPEAAVPKSFMKLNTNKGKAIIYFDKIALISTSEQDSRDKIAHLFDGQMFVLKNITFDKLEELLPEQDFSRINKRELLALKAIMVYSFDEITTKLLDNSGKNRKFTLSENYRNVFLQKVSL